MPLDNYRDELRRHPGRSALIAAVLGAHDALPLPTPRSEEVVAEVRAGRVEVLLDPALPAGGGVTPGESPVILGARGVLDGTGEVAQLVLGLVHEVTHVLDVAAGRCRPGAEADWGERFFTELHAYAAEWELAHANGLEHLLAPEFWGTEDFQGIVNAVLTVEGDLATRLNAGATLEWGVRRQVAAMFPSIPDRRDPEAEL